MLVDLLTLSVNVPAGQEPVAWTGEAHSATALERVIATDVFMAEPWLEEVQNDCDAGRGLFEGVYHLRPFISADPIETSTVVTLPCDILPNQIRPSGSEGVVAAAVVRGAGPSSPSISKTTASPKSSPLFQPESSWYDQRQFTPIVATDGRVLRMAPIHLNPSCGRTA